MTSKKMRTDVCNLKKHHDLAGHIAVNRVWLSFIDTNSNWISGASICCQGCDAAEKY